MSKTYVYIDGFNLYHGALKGTKHQWLNLRALSEILLPNHDVTQINFYTATLHARPGREHIPQNQQLYFRALRTLPNVEIILGQFVSHEVQMPRARGAGREWVIKTEEKGSDVNIGNDMVRDACFGKYETAVLISNDSDLARSVDTVATDFNLPVIVVNPFTRNPTHLLIRNASYSRIIRQGALKRSQFPNQLRDKHGNFRKPKGW